MQIQYKYTRGEVAILSLKKSYNFNYIIDYDL